MKLTKVPCQMFTPASLSVGFPDKGQWHICTESCGKLTIQSCGSSWLLILSCLSSNKWFPHGTLEGNLCGHCSAGLDRMDAYFTDDHMVAVQCKLQHRESVFHRRYWCGDSMFDTNCFVFMNILEIKALNKFNILFCNFVLRGTTFDISGFNIFLAICWIKKHNCP